MPVSIATLTAIVQSGGGFEIDAFDYDPAALVAFIGQMDTTAVLRVRNAKIWTQDQLVSVSRAAPPGVAQFVF